MKTRHILFLVLLSIAITSLTTGCALPRKIWPQKDIAAMKATETTGKPTLLLASRDSEFKADLVKKITAAMAQEDVAIDIVGIEDLADIDTGQYAAAVAISTCMAWGLDPLVRNFIDRYPDKRRILLVITSNSEWLPKEEDADVDAISSASELADSGLVSKRAVMHIREKLQLN